MENMGDGQSGVTVSDAVKKTIRDSVRGLESKKFKVAVLSMVLIFGLGAFGYLPDKEITIAFLQWVVAPYTALQGAVDTVKGLKGGA